MVGAGVVGAGVAWHLARQGHRITLIDPGLEDPVERSGGDGNRLTGTSASLGVLMGHVFRRSSGRGWRLRQRSMALWPSWVSELQRQEPHLMLETPLLQLADGDETLGRMQSLVNNRAKTGLSLLDAHQLQHIWPGISQGGLLSERDGRINPLLLLRALRKALADLPVTGVTAAVETISRTDPEQRGGWRLNCHDGRCLHQDTVVICAALNSPALLQPLGHPRPMQPVLGQALKLEITSGPTDWTGWPAVLVHRGYNLIPDGHGHVLLGATVEPGERSEPEPLHLMRHLDDSAPEWLRNAKVLDHWSGLRARPVERPAPLLERLEPGLLLATGHYRNGVLLTPATAEWVEQTLKKSVSSSTCS